MEDTKNYIDTLIPKLHKAFVEVLKEELKQQKAELKKWSWNSYEKAKKQREALFQKYKETPVTDNTAYYKALAKYEEQRQNVDKIYEVVSTEEAIHKSMDIEENIRRLEHMIKYPKLFINSTIYMI